MKVFFPLENRGVIGGGVKAAWRLADKLTKDYGVEVGMLGPSCSESYSGFINYRYDAGSAFSLNYYLSLIRCLQEFRPDVVHCMGLYTALLVLSAKSAFDYKVTVTVHHTRKELRGGIIARLFGKLIAQGIDHVNFLTEFQAEHYKQVHGFKPRKYSIIPNIVEAKKPDQETVQILRENLLKTMRSDYILCFAGRLIPSKQVDVFIKTVEILLSEGINCLGLIIGSGPEDYVNYLREESSKIKDKVVFTGFIYDPEKYLAASDCFLFPTMHPEALPNVIVECFLNSVPVVASPIKQLEGLVVHRVNGLVAKEHDAAEYARLVKSILLDRQLKKTVSESGYASYLNKLESSKVSKEYYDIYNSLVGG
ncbi:MAG: glycosyltransferase family 4 protein [Peptococcaceae bacterium]|nr:glycosyltransferase family 4 protein [Peptococcaceae bacterium]